MLGGSALALALVVLISAIAVARDTRDGDEAPEPQSSPEDCQGPWSECSPDAQWLRRALPEGGLKDAPPGTGSALLITRDGPSGLFLWAVRPRRPAISIEDSAYTKLVRVGDTPVYTDGVRAVWPAQDRHVYLEPVPELKLLEKLVQLTRVVPAPEVD
jgi:hypothetical protein